MFSMGNLNGAVISCSCRGTDECGNYNIHGGLEVPVLINLTKEGNIHIGCPLRCSDNTCRTPNNRNYDSLRGFCAYILEYNKSQSV